MPLSVDELRQRRLRKRLIAEIKKREQEEARRLNLEDPERFIAECAGLNVADMGDGLPYFDINTPESPYRVMNDFLNNNNGKWKVIFAGRRTGKTYFIQQWLLRKQMLNRDITIFIGGESTERAITRADWLRGRYEILEPKYGPFRSSLWKRDTFTIRRPKGEKGGDPSVATGGPEKGGTGKHPDIMWFDDVVGEVAYESIAEQKKTVSWLKDKLIFWMGTNTELVITGTMWPGSFHLYRYIYDEVEGKPAMKEIAPCVRLAEGKVFDILSFSSGYKERKQIFACLPMSFLDKQFALNPVMASAQYDNNMLDNTDVMFSSRDISIAPLPEGVPFTTYFVSDTSGTKKGGPGTSITCFAIVALTPDDHAYVLYCRAGPFHPDIGPDIALDMIQQCHSERKVYPEAIWFEDSGPGAMYPSLMRTKAEARGMGELPIMEIHRSTDTHQRIMAWLLGPVKAGRLHFAPEIANDPQLLQIDESGYAQGLIAQDFLTYAYTADGKKPDILDAFCDIFACNQKGGVRMCPPPARREEREVPSMTHTEAYFREMRRQYERDYGEHTVE